MGAKDKNLEVLKWHFTDNVPKFVVVNSKENLNKQFETVAKAFGKDDIVAFRSSANVEDGEQHSFAGMFESFLNVPFDKENFIKYVDKCRRSAKSNRVIAYAKSQNIDHSKIEVKVIVQKMFVGKYSGVAFYDPNSVSLLSIGKGEQVVKGDDAQEFAIDKNIVDKLPQDISRHQWNNLVSAVKSTYDIFKTPQDIEWAISSDKFVLLQARPITHDLQSKSLIGVWDASNIGENYPGTTLPLTYSFIKKSYGRVYSHFLSIVGTAPNKIKLHQTKLQNMLGYINGHVYYNINNWYEFLKLLPFYSVNRTFFETMLSPGKKRTEKENIKWDLGVISLFTFIIKLNWPNKYFKRFDKQFKKEVNRFASVNLNNRNEIQLIELFETVSERFFSIWGYTIINDFRVMINFGLLTKLANKWLKEPEKYINSLIDVSDFPESMKPLDSLASLASLITKSQKLQELFTKDSYEILQVVIKSQDTDIVNFYREFIIYLDKYGNRSANELKLEEPKFREKPEEVISLLKQYYLARKDSYSQNSKNNKFQIIEVSYLKRAILNFFEKHTVKGVYLREKNRLRRGYVFNFARETFLELGARFVKSSLLKDKHDIFYLYQEEIFNTVRFHILPVNFKIIIQNRKLQLEEYSKKNLPMRVKSFGVGKASELVSDLHGMTNELKGNVTSFTEGSIEGEAVVLDKFDVEQNIAGKILITSKTDPGWTVLFPLLKGVVTEYGNTLSHASIISRELGIPCIVGVVGVINKIKTGDKIKLNTQTGIITKI